MIYDRLTTRYTFACPEHGDTRVALSRFDVDLGSRSLALGTLRLGRPEVWVRWTGSQWILPGFAAGPAAPAGTALPTGIAGARQVEVQDPSNPSAAPTYAYVMLSTDAGPKPAD